MTIHTEVASCSGRESQGYLNAWRQRASGALVATFLLFAFGAAVPLSAFAVDNDGDGFDPPADCNDNNAAIFPGAPELCGDGIDSNCDGEDFTGPDNNGDAQPDKVGDVCIAATTGPGGVCKTASPGGYVCSGDQLSLVCPAVPVSSILQYAAETLAMGNCADGDDNDCDGDVDTQDSACQTAELCDGLDNDGDGLVDEIFNKGAACTVNAPGAASPSACEKSGLFICKADKTGTECSASPGAPQTELNTVGNTCGDGSDNDCDGSIDGADAGCLGFGVAELCDGLDNDNDGTTDEGFFGLGSACSNGTGACAAGGTVVCDGFQTGTECDAIPLAAAPEVGIVSCTDLADNDCDGLTDAQDSDCNDVLGIAVSCSLPYLTGQQGADCTGDHLIQFSANVDDVRADLLALDENGDLLHIFEDVQNGDQAYLHNRLRQFKWGSREARGHTRYNLTVPLPLLRVTATAPDGSTRQAYCSNVPYLDVVQPDGNVVSLSEGDSIEVHAQIPLSDVDTLQILVDGVDILPLIGGGIDPADFPGTYCVTPGSCLFSLNTSGGPVDVEVRDLIVNGIDSTQAANTAAGVGIEAQNVLSMRLIGLPAGGHIVYVDGEPIELSPLTNRRLNKNRCLRDDIADAGTLSVFGINIDLPAAQSVVSAPTQVTGEVRGGFGIESLSLNGAPVDVSGQVFTPGDGMTTADEVVLLFDEMIGQTDLQQVVGGTAPLGTFAPGSNRLVADASDVQGNRTFADRIFATGNVQSPAPQTLSFAAEQYAAAAQSVVVPAYQSVQAAVVQEIENAFVIGLDADGTEEFFQAKCDDAINEFKTKVDERIRNVTFGQITIDPDCSCTVTANIVLDDVSFAGTESCVIDFQDGLIDLTVNLPDVIIDTSARNSCKTTFLGICTTKTSLNFDVLTKIEDIVFSVDITEEQILTQTAPDPDTEVTFDFKTPIEPDVTNNSGTSCIGTEICELGQFVVGGLAFVFTFGIVEPTDIFDFLSVDVNFFDDAIGDALGSSEPDPMDINEIQVDEQQLDASATSATVDLAAVEITPLGLTAALSGAFETSEALDPEVEQTPGAVLTPAAAPTVSQAVPGANDISMLIADDVFNQIFASIAATGGLKTSCQDTGKTVGDVLPANCESLDTDGNPAATTTAGEAGAQGLCHGVRTDTTPDCGSLTNTTNPLLQPVERGVCHGVRGNDCTVLPFLEKATCNATPQLNLAVDDNLLLCARQDMPPQLVFGADAGNDQLVETSLLLNDTSVAFVLDRATDGYGGSLNDLSGCFGETGNAAPDCLLYAVCLDLTLVTQMGLDSSECQAGQTGFVFAVNSVITSGLEPGVVCSAGSQTDDDLLTDTGASDATITELRDNADELAPPICVDGLNLGGVLNFSGPAAKLFSVQTNGGTGFADYLGLTGEFQ